MDYLPISLRVKDRQCLIVGGGEVALRKASLLSRAGARLRIVAPDIDVGFSGFVGAELLPREYEAGDLEDAWVVVAATDDESLNARISADAGSRGVPVNVVDDPSRCTFVMPAIVDRSPILVAISSAGASPVLARTVRGDIEALLPPGLGALADLLGRHRGVLKRTLPALAERRTFVEAVLTSDVVALVESGAEREAEQLLLQRLNTREPSLSATGRVYVVGIGPGDPDLLTFAAQRLMQQADRLFYGLEVSEALLDRCRRDAHRNPMPGAALGGAAAFEPWQRAIQGAVDNGERVALLVPGRGDELLAHLVERGLREAWGLRAVLGVSIEICS